MRFATCQSMLHKPTRNNVDTRRTKQFERPKIGWLTELHRWLQGEVHEIKISDPFHYGYVVALANLNELDALLLLRDELVSQEDEFSTVRILGCTRNCSELQDCDNTSELVSRISGLISNLEKTWESKCARIKSTHWAGHGIFWRFASNRRKRSYVRVARFHSDAPIPKPEVNRNLSPRRDAWQKIARKT